MEEVSYKPLMKSIENAFHSILVGTLLVVLAIGNVYFYSEKMDRDIEILLLEQKVQMVETERDALKYRLDAAWVPESSWSELGHNRIVVPVQKAYNWTKSLFVEDEQESVVLPDTRISREEYLRLKKQFYGEK